MVVRRVNKAVINKPPEIRYHSKSQVFTSGWYSMYAIDINHERSVTGSLSSGCCWFHKRNLPGSGLAVSTDIYRLNCL